MEKKPKVPNRAEAMGSRFESKQCQLVVCSPQKVGELELSLPFEGSKWSFPDHETRLKRKRGRKLCCGLLSENTQAGGHRLSDTRWLLAWSLVLEQSQGSPGVIVRHSPSSYYKGVCR